MSRMLCKCGELLGTSVSPSPCVIYVYYDWEIQSALEYNSEILLSDFLTDWDEKRGEQKEFMKRPQPVEYWYCNTCHRVYEIQAIANGQILRVYQRKDEVNQDLSYDNWTKIYIFSDMEIDAVLEKHPKMLLSDYLKKKDTICYYLSPNENDMVMIECNHLKCSYTKDSIEQK